MQRRTIEIKARCNDHEHIRALLYSRGADFRGTDHQVDTYFDVPSGRLKLREGTIENALIHYEREDQAGPKQSNVVLFPVQPGSSLKQILTKSLGVEVVVEKHREIYFIGNVKFHLDRVTGLGEFVEIEAIGVDETQNIETLHEQCASFIKFLGIVKDDLLVSSYSDMHRCVQELSHPLSVTA